MAKQHDVVFVTSEMYPFSKTGGLADVLGALPQALAAQGLNVAVVTPLYGRLSSAGYQLRLVAPDCHVGYPWPPITAEIYQADCQGVTVYFVQREEYFDRRAYYNTYKGDYFDNCERFNFFCKATIAWLRRLGAAPRVIHANDWQAALVCAYIAWHRTFDPYWAQTRTIQTIHNLAFQGRFDARLFFESGLPDHFWHMDGCEFWGDFNLLKSGIAYADMVTTVSPSYAEEILTPEFGCGLEGILNKRRPVLRGILNGADYEVWNPSGNRFLPCCYDPDNLDGKKVCKQELIREMFLSDMLEDRPLLGFIGRIRRQKGIDLLIDLIPRLMRQGLGIVILGEGNLEFEAKLLDLMEEYHGQLAVQIGYTEDLAHRIHAGCDIFLMPSSYEPCGLTQMYALRYGTPPVATAVGGLRDTIVPHPEPEATGFTFPVADPGLFSGAIQDAVRLFGDKEAWRAMVRRTMLQDFSWRRAAGRYIEVYEELRSRGPD